MTTTASKGAGRARHAARTTKAAQRTPLPPRDGSQDATPADVAANDASRKAAVSPAVCPLGGCGLRHRAGTKIAHEHAETAKRFAEVRENGPDALPGKPDVPNRTVKPAEATAPGAGAKRASKSTQPKKASAGAIPEGTAGADKIQRLLDGAAEAGWSGAWGLFPPATVVVTTTRGPESIVTTFTDGKLDLSAMPLYSPEEGRSVKLKNVSAVLHQMAGDRPGLVKATRAAPSERAPRRTKAERAESGERRLPFDPETATDEEIQEAIRGRAIEWMNGISRNVESATVLAYRQIRNPDAGKPGEPDRIQRPAKIEVKPMTGPSARPTRIVTFADPFHTGIRTVALDRLLSVR